MTKLQNPATIFGIDKIYIKISFQCLELTESDDFLRDEGPFVSWPPSLLEDLLEEVLKYTVYHT